MTWQISTDVVWIDDSDEVRLYDAAAGDFRTLNATATAVWRAVAAGDSLDGMVQRFAESFQAGDDAQRRAIAGDVREFLDDLTAQGLLVSSS